MRRLAVILTTSLDGFIADPQGGVDWLGEPPEAAPEDYRALMDSVDCLVMGSATYQVSLKLEGGVDVFAGKEVYVFTARGDLPEHPGVAFVDADAVEFTSRLKESEGGTVWLFGGGRLATALSDAELVDDYYIAVQPILLGDGIPLWVVPHARTDLELTSVSAWPGGIAALRYSGRSRSS